MSKKNKSRNKKKPVEALEEVAAAEGAAAESTESVPEKREHKRIEHPAIKADPSEFLGAREVSPLPNGNILSERFGFRLGYREAGVNCKEKNCFTLLEEKKPVGVIPRLPLSVVWNKACEWTGGDPEAKLGIQRAEWDKVVTLLTKYMKKEGGKSFSARSPALIQDVWQIPELDFFELYLPKATKAVALMDAAIRADIAETEALNARWKKIKNYPHKVMLEEEFGGIFSKADAEVLRANGVQYLNDLKGVGVLDLKNMFLSHTFTRLPEEINAAFKEDLERRKDFRYRFWPFFIGAIALAATTVVDYLYRYTLLKNLPMTAVIFLLLAIWVVTVSLVVRGAARAVRRRRTKRPDYYYFIKPVRVVCSLFAIFSVFAIGSTSLFYERYDDYDDTFYYRNLGEGQIAVAGRFDEEATNLTVPETVNGDTVVRVAPYSFLGLDVGTVVLPDTVTEVGHDAFRGCNELTSVTLPTGLTEIADRLFKGCASLREVGIPSGVTRIGNFAFDECDALGACDLPAATASLGKGAFEGCDALTRVTAEGALTEVKARAFKDCPLLAEVTAGNTDGLLAIEDSTFENCAALLTTNLFDHATTVGSRALAGCSAFASLVLSDDLTSIGEDLLYGCTGLRELTTPFIGEDLTDYQKYDYLFDETTPIERLTVTKATEIAKDAFRGSKTLRTVVLNEVTKLGNRAFSNCSALEYVSCPKVTSVPDEAFADCTLLATFEGIEAITSFGVGAFRYDNMLEVSSLTATEIGNGAFRGCVSIEELTIAPATLGGYAFDSCTSLREVRMQGSATVIPEHAFAYCQSLESIEWTSVTELGESAFDGCRELAAIDLTGVTKLGERALAGCSSLKQVIVPDSVTEMGEELFYGDDSLSLLRLPFVGEKAAKSNKGQLSRFVDRNKSVPLTVDVGASRIYESWFGGMSCVSDVILRNATAIDASSFTDLGGLTSVVLSDSISEIPDSAFFMCGRLTEIEGGAAVKKLGKSAFDGCGLLEGVYFPATESIGARCFAQCISLVSIGDMPALSFIGSDAFESCSSLESFVVPTTVTEVEAGMFSGCGLTSITLHEGVKKIGKDAFKDCTVLEEIYIPNAVTEIGESAFEGCIALREIDLTGTSAKIGKNAFAYCTSLASILLPTSVEEIPEGMARGSSLAEGIEFPATVTKIGDYAFAYSGLEDYTINEGVTKVGKGAFMGCDNMPSAYLPDSVRSVGRDAFADCSQLRTVDLPFLGKSPSNARNGFSYVFGEYSSVSVLSLRAQKKIAGNTFKAGKSNIRGLAFGEGVTSIASSAFRAFTSLTEVILPTTLRSIGSNAFRDCSSLTGIVLPDTVKKMGTSAFRGCDGLSSVRFGEALKEVPTDCFRDCGRLSSVHLNENLRKIGSRAFYNCSSLRSITFNSGLEEVGSQAFRRCKLTEVDLNDGIERVGRNAFRENDSLTYARIPSSAKHIGAYVFRDCSSLRELSVPFLGGNINSKSRLTYLTKTWTLETVEISNARKIGRRAFDDFRIGTLILHGDIADIHENAFGDCAPDYILTTSDVYNTYRYSFPFSSYVSIG